LARSVCDVVAPWLARAGVNTGERRIRQIILYVDAAAGLLRIRRVIKEAAISMLVSVRTSLAARGALGLPTQICSTHLFVVVE